MSNPHRCKVTLSPLGRVLEVEKGSNLGELIHDLGLEFPCGGKGTCGNCKIKLLEGKISVSEPHRKVLERKKLGPMWRLSCLSQVEGDITIEVAQFENIVLADDTPFHFTPQNGCGIAIDIGSTTIVSQLLDLKNGQVLAVQTDINPQARHGADIMSRIGYALQSAKHAEQLTRLVRESVGAQLKALVRHTDQPIRRIRLVGNTVMHHLFCGLDVTPLAGYPFDSPHNGMVHFRAEELGWTTNYPSEITFLPNIGGFVGSDVLAGIYAAGMFTCDQLRVLVDLGTNGELAVGKRGRIVCASTAAGPAFEGSNISCGMRASTGAISSISREGSRKKYHIIGNGAAKGICGSGLIDAIYYGILEKSIDAQGVIRTPTRCLPLIDKKELTQSDIREFQLAKAAIATGVELLLKEGSLSREHIEKMFIAGGFGNYINLTHAVGLGVLEFPEEKIVKLSNSALIGAKMFLFQEDDFINALLDNLSHFSLEADPCFVDIYTEKILFELQ